MAEVGGYPALLAGVRVLDFTHALAGPFSTQLLADLGAQVLKVEPPTGDKTRRVPPHFVDGTSLYFHSINRNKKSLALDLKSEGGQRVLRDLVRHFDVVMMNFSPGVAARLGLSHERLRDANPRIITCTMSSFGPKHTGAGRGTDLIAQAMAGAMSITGYEHTGPARAGVPTADLSGGFYCTIAVLAALQHRSVTGVGIELDTSLFHSQLSLLNYMGAYVARTGVPLGPLGSGYPATVPAQAFATADDRWLVVDAGFDHHFGALCRAIERPELSTDPRFEARIERLNNRSLLTQELEAIFRTKPRDEWVLRLQDNGVPAAPVNDMLEALRSTPAGEGGLARMTVGEEVVEVLRSPVWIDSRNDHPMAPPPRLGEGGISVLLDVLGYTQSEVHDLEQSGVLWQPEEPASKSNV